MVLLKFIVIHNIKCYFWLVIKSFKKENIKTKNKNKKTKKQNKANKQKKQKKKRKKKLYDKNSDRMVI